MKYNIGLTSTDLGLSQEAKVVVNSPEFLVVQVESDEWYLYPADFDAEYDNPVVIREGRKYNPSRPDVATGVLRYSSVAAAVNAIESLIQDNILPQDVKIYNSDGTVMYQLDGNQVITVLGHKNSGRGRSSDPNTPIWHVIKVATAHIDDVANYIKTTFNYDPTPTKLSEFSRKKEA